ncbi:MAG: CopG family antitoxin [Cyanobacteria bacterium J06581_3]
MAKSRLSSISRVDIYEKMGEFWDTHDITDFDNPDLPDVEFEVACNVTVESNLLNEIEQWASQQGVDTKVLVNLWLREKLAEQAAW